jgi:hypothetical protein
MSTVCVAGVLRTQGSPLFSAISGFGDNLRYELIKPVLEHCSVESLARLEEASPVCCRFIGILQNFLMRLIRSTFKRIHQVCNYIILGDTQIDDAFRALEGDVLSFLPPRSGAVWVKGASILER